VEYVETLEIWRVWTFGTLIINVVQGEGDVLAKPFIEGPKATYTVGKSTRSEKDMQHTINKTHGNRQNEIETKHCI